MSACNALWRIPTVAIDHLGADVRCVWNSFKALYLQLGVIVSDAILTGWAEQCDSWLDPTPELRFLDRCINLLVRISPDLYDALGLGNSSAFCTFTDETYESHEILGRCGQLKTLNTMTRRFALAAENNGQDRDESLILPEFHHELYLLVK